PKSHKSSGSYGDSVVVEEFQRTVKEEVALEKAKRQTKKKKKKKKRKNMNSRKSSTNVQITCVLLRARIGTEQEKGKTKRLFQTVEEKNERLQPQRGFFKKKLLRLRSRSSPVYKKTYEKRQMNSMEVESRFMIWHCHELCCRLQAQVIQCSRENT
uniref:Uncharacterized protein n=1 Tax=Sus scrofa TaxID=9823 RepID=A0A8D0URA7_PIG